MAGDGRPFGELFAEPTRNGLTRPKAVRGDGVKMVNMGELFAHPRLRNARMDRVPLSASESEKFLLREGDLLFARQSLVLEGAGKCSIFLGDDEPVTFESHVTRVRLNPATADPAFYFYYLQSHHGRAAIRSIVEQGAGASGIRGSDLESLDVLWRPLPEQRAIAHILGTLDDKIELNRRMSETLEAMARALFKSWFVDFAPVRAKAEGRDPGLPKPLADLFPARLVDSELGEIPEGWEVGRVADIGNVICGKTPSTRQQEYYGDDVPFITIPDMHGKIFAARTQKRLSHTGAMSQPNKTLPPGSICVSCIATPGLVVIASEAAQTNQQINSIIPTNNDHRLFWYWILRGLGDQIRASGSGGSVLSNLSTGRFADLRILAPSHEIRSSYHARVAHLFDRILATERETITLATLRDTLLPKLISGELRVKDAERFLSVAT